MKYPSEPQLERRRAMRNSVGMVTSYLPKKGYGFLWSEQDSINCFFHIKDYKGEREPERGDMVSFCATSSDRGVRAKEVRLVESGKLRDPALVGITCWTGPGRSGEYGLALHKGKRGDGTFIHKTCLVDGSSSVESNALYKMDVAKDRERYIGLNVRQIPTNQDALIDKLAHDPSEDQYVRLKAFEILSIREGRYEEFAAKIKEFAKSHPMPPPPETTIKLPGGFEFTQKGTPPKETVKFAKTVIIGGVGFLVTLGLIIILSKSGSEGGSSDLSGLSL